MADEDTASRRKLTALIAGAACVLGICLASNAQLPSESSRDLGFGFREVQREQVNPPGHWEGIAHYSYVYFGDTLLCRCTADLFFISPSGRYAIFHNEDSGILSGYRIENRQTIAITSKFVGLPRKVEWNEPDYSAIVHFHQDVAGYPKATPLRVNLGAK